MIRVVFTLLLVFMPLAVFPSKNTSEEPITYRKPTLNIPQDHAWRLMIGRWYGKQPTTDGRMRKQVIQRFPHGVYIVTFRIYEEDGSFEEQTETGHWGISGPVYFTIFRGWIKGQDLKEADPRDPYNYDAYKILRLDEEVLTYENFNTRSRYSVRKVSDSFGFDDDLPNEN